MALDKLTLVNQAAGLIGDDPIDALDAQTPGAQAVSLLYDSLLQYCVGVHDWSFATATRQLTRRNDVTPFTGWRYVFALPPDRIEQPIKCAPTADWPRAKFTDYVLEGGDLHCDEPAMYALIRVLPAPAAMSATFRRAFMIALAADLYMARSSDKDGRDRMRAEALGPPSMNGVGGLMATAIQQDRRSQPSKAPTDGYDPLTSAHRSSGGGGFTFP